MMDNSPRSGALGGQFIDIEERSVAILHILDKGWKRASASPQVHVAVGEVEITEHLRVGMRDTLNESDAPYCKKITIQAGTQSRSRPNVWRPDGITDISIFFSDIREKYGEHDAHAIVECKRVAGNRTDLCRQYVVEGIDRFATRKYAGNHPVAFMAGYLLSGDAESAATGVNAYLTGKGRRSEHLRVSSLTDASWARSSRHPRPDAAKPIDLHHAFLGLRRTRS